MNPRNICQPGASLAAIVAGESRLGVAAGCRPERLLLLPVGGGDISPLDSGRGSKAAMGATRRRRGGGCCCCSVSDWWRWSCGGCCCSVSDWWWWKWSSGGGGGSGSVLLIMRRSSCSSGRGGGEGVEQGGETQRAAATPRRPSVPTVGEQGGVGSLGFRRPVVPRRGSVLFSSAWRKETVIVLSSYKDLI